MSQTSSIVGTVQVTDSVTGTVPLQKNLVGLAFTGTNAAVVQSQNIGTATVTFTLPVSPVQFLYVKNLHGSQTVTVTWTPTGGASNPVLTLEPSAALMFCEPASGGGITAMQVVASGASTPIEYLLAG